MKKIDIWLLFMILLLLFVILKPLYEYHSLNIFEIKKNKYILKILENRNYSINGIEEDIFYYQYNGTIKIGCGKLQTIGIDLKKEYLYGNLKYKEKYRGIGIYFYKRYNIIGRDLFENLEIFPYNEVAADKISNICNGYFILNLKTGEYTSNLSYIEYKKILFNKKINNKVMTVSEFLKRNGKKIFSYNLKEVEYWMSTREPK